MNARIGAMALCCMLLWCACSAASGQVNIGVNTLVDAPDFDLSDGICDCDAALPGPQCSLRAAVQNANLLGGWVVINLGPNVYNLTFGGTDDASVAGDLDIFSAILARLEIRGVQGTVISGNGLIVGSTPDRIIHITQTVSNTLEVIISDLTISDGAGVLLGAGIRHQAGKLTLNNVWLVDCNANDSGGGVHTTSLQPFTHTGGGYSNCDAAFNGGGIYIDCPSATLNGVSMFNCNVSNLGGAVRVAQNGIAVIANSSIGASNGAGSGGGISNRGTLTVNDTVIAANFASGSGGGIANNIGGSLELNRCTINQNQANTGGGLNNSSGASVVDCTFRLNNADAGGGIFNTAGAATPLRMRRSTIAFNFATGSFGGGGYRGFGALDMVNCTISNNAAQSGFGGGIYFDGGLNSPEINATTIANNYAGAAGGGLYIDNGLGATPITFRSVIIANNTIGPGAANNFAGNYLPTSNGHNLDSDGSCLFPLLTDLSNVNPLLGPLQNNGGLTETRALQPGSPAINAGSCTTINGNTITEDQRGFLRNAPCDIGAFEAGGIPPPPNDLCAQATPIGPGSLIFPNAGANTDGPPEPGCGFTGLPGQDSDVWFEFVAPCNGTVTFELVPLPPGSPDRLLAVYDACPTAGGGGGTLIGCASAVGGPPASVTAIAVAGQTYIIRAGMPGGNQGNSILNTTIACACPADITGDNVVNVSDLLAVIGSWGPCPAPPAACPADVAPVGPPQGDGMVNVSDLLLVIGAWGPCP